MLCFRLIPFLCACVFALPTDQKLGANGIQLKYRNNETCSRNCSQTTPRFYNDKETFICTIGNKEELDQYRHNYQNMLENAQLRFDAPRLTDIRLHRKNSDRSLNITFQLPKAKDDSMLKTKYVRAVFFRFESVEESAFRDEFFYSNPQERLFEFHEFEPISSYDIVNPRKINYDCLLGLNESLPTAVYKITLESAPGYNITYYFTLPGETILEENWLPAIATSSNATQRSILVVFEESAQESEDMFPLYDKQLYYIVSLLKDGVVIQFKKIELGYHVVKFENLTHGRFNIMVSKCVKWSERKIRTCNSATSHTVDARVIPKEKETDDNIVSLVVAVAMSGTLVFLVLFFAAIFRLIACKKNNRQKVPLAFSDERTEEEFEVAEPLNEIEENENELVVPDARAATEEIKLTPHVKVTVPNDFAEKLLAINESGDSSDELSVDRHDANDNVLDMLSTTYSKEPVVSGVLSNTRVGKSARPNDRNMFAHVNDNNPNINLPHSYNCPRHKCSNERRHCRESEERSETVDFDIRNGAYNVRRNVVNGQVINTRADVHRCVHGHHHLSVAHDDDVNVHTKLPLALIPNGDLFQHTSSNHYKHHFHPGGEYYHKPV